LGEESEVLWDNGKIGMMSASGVRGVGYGGGGPIFDTEIFII